MKKVVCLGFSFWKKKFISRYLAPVVCIFEKSDYFEKKNPGAKNNEHFRNSSGNINIAFWASQFIRDPYINRLEYFYRNNSDCFSIIHIEDGFIRSNGLGSNFFYPYSLVFDRSGIYYDPSHECNLEKILSSLNTKYSDEEYTKLRQQALSLKKLIIKNDISKYSIRSCKNKKHDAIDLKETEPRYSKDYFYNNLNDIAQAEKQFNNVKKIIFIPTQVDDDASMILGGCGFTNLSLLKVVRGENPDAIIICKIHPDIVSGNRYGDTEFKEYSKYADFIYSTEVSITECLNLCDEVHTISSLSGFEALLRGKKVFCYGMPFYAGYGLTTDYSVIKQHPIAVKAYVRRKEINLFSGSSSVEDALANLIIGTLILYPTYYSWENNKLSNVEEVISELIQNNPSKQNKLFYLYSRLTLPFRKKFITKESLLKKYTDR